MDHIVGAELAFASARAGHPCLRFNYRGVGASQGTRGGLDACVADALAALEVAVENADGGPVVVASIHGSDAVALELWRLEQSRPQASDVQTVLWTLPAHAASDDLTRTRQDPHSVTPRSWTEPEGHPQCASWP